jgi:hypothetical protein
MEFVKYIPSILISVTVAAFISTIWVNRINYMIKNHFDYNGEDFLDEDDKIQIG